MNTTQVDDHLERLIEDHFSSCPGMEPWEKGRQELISTLDAIIGSHQSDFLENPVDAAYPDRSEYYRRLQKGLRHHWDLNRGLKIEELMGKIPKDTVFETSSPLYQISSLEEVVLAVAVTQRKSVEGKMKISEKKAFQLFHDCYRPVCLKIVQRNPDWRHLTIGDSNVEGWWAPLHNLLIGIATKINSVGLRNAGLDSFMGESNLRSWLDTTVFRFVQKHLNRWHPPLPPDPPKPPIKQEDRVLLVLLIKMRNRAIAQLSPKERELLDEHYTERLRVGEIAERRERSRGRISHLLTNIRKKIADFVNMNLDEMDATELKERVNTLMNLDESVIVDGFESIDE